MSASPIRDRCRYAESARMPFAWHWSTLVRLGCSWARRAATRRQLAALDRHLLADVGISVRKRERECRKWFWQA